jgi:hypothetical protein
MVARNGYSYTVTPSTFEMTRAFASALRGLVDGRAVSDSGLSALIASLGPGFSQWAYNKGEIDRGQFLEFERQLKESGKEAAHGR